MLIFSTKLDINDTLTKDVFIELVIRWNQGSFPEENRIKDITWQGEHNIKYGNEKMGLEIQEYRNGNAITARYEKIDEEGVVWDTDFTMNFDEMKLAIQLDRGYLPDAQMLDSRFSSPYFITMLADGGYLKDDNGLSITQRPVYIDVDNARLLSDVVNGEKQYNMPVVYVSKNKDDTDPVDVRLLARKLRGAAHVLVQKGTWSNPHIRRLCNDQNEYYGGIGVYFPSVALPHRRFFNHTGIMEKIVRTVVTYSLNQKIEKLYTFPGVYNAMLRDRWRSRGEDLKAMEYDKKVALFAQELAEIERTEAVQEKEEAVELIRSTDEEIKDLQAQVEMLSHENERLTFENNGLRMKLNDVDSQPLLYFGDEDDFFPGEIKDMVLSVLDEAIKDKSASRRTDVLRSIIERNNYQRLLDKRLGDLKGKLKDYKTMTKSLKSFLVDFGFCVDGTGKHYDLTYFGDPRYCVTLAKTGSDFREGRNTIDEIKKCML